VLVDHRLGDDLGGRHALALGHRGAPSSIGFDVQSMSLGPAVAGTSFRPYSWAVTPLLTT
jgi:hypothetical protein